MKKMFLLIFLCVFLLTGCDVEYNLTINEDTFDESVTMSFLKSNTNYDRVLAYKNSQIPVSRNSVNAPIYNSEILDNDNYYDLVYSYTHDFSNISNSYFISNCYNGFNITNTDDKLVLSSGDKFGCFIGDDGLRADSVKINITTKLKVLSNNADEVNGNTYTWNINENNYLTKEVNMEVQKVGIFSNNLNEPVEASYITGIIVFCIIVIGGLIFLFIRYRSRKNNDF